MRRREVLAGLGAVATLIVAIPVGGVVVSLPFWYLSTRSPLLYTVAAAGALLIHLWHVAKNRSNAK